MWQHVIANRTDRGYRITSVSWKISQHPITGCLQSIFVPEKDEQIVINILNKCNRWIRRCPPPEKYEFPLHWRSSDDPKMFSAELIMVHETIKNVCQRKGSFPLYGVLFSTGYETTLCHVYVDVGTNEPEYIQLLELESFYPPEDDEQEEVISGVTVPESFVDFVREVSPSSYAMRSVGSIRNLNKENFIADVVNLAMEYIKKEFQL